MTQNCEGSLGAAHGAPKQESESCEVIASPARESAVIAEVVSPAISPAVSPASTGEQSTIDGQGSQPGNQSGTRNEKPDCYKCIHRRPLTYSAHSECGHPVLDGKGRVLAMALLLLDHSGSRLPLGVKGSQHGISQGWFYWPMDFDPIWLESCDGFEAQAGG